jgi:hypothetical protein
MSDLTRFKLGLTLAGLAVFGAGIRFDSGRLRYIGIGFVAAAWLLRFLRRDRQEPQETEGEKE